MIRPRRAWPLYEKFLRSVPGGKVGVGRGRERRYDVEHARGARDRRRLGRPRGGPAAHRRRPQRRRHRGRPGRVDSGEGFEVVNGTALGVFEGGLVPVDAGALLLRYRASRIVAAAGAVEQPLIFPGTTSSG